MSNSQKSRLANAFFLLLFLLLIGIGLIKEHWLKPAPVEGRAIPGARAPLQAEENAAVPDIVRHPAAATLTGQISRPGQLPEEDLQMLRQVLDLYHRAHGENPEGDNADVVQALLGNNPHHTAFLLADASFIQDGLLHDRWGTPYFIHPENAHTMTVRSAGPDRLLFNDDDVVED